jgi:quinone-modifying oxidoreductase subunit QmoA
MSDGGPNGGIAVIGGGIAGVTAAVEAAEAGHDVYLLEREAFLGGRVTRSNHYFPKLCPPGCGLEINFRRIKQNPRIKVLTLAEVTGIEGQAGDLTLTVKLAPRFVNARCTGCGECVKACPVQRPDDFNMGMGTTRAIYLPHSLAYPQLYLIDPDACEGKSCARCLAYCAYDAIDLGQQPRTMQLRVGSAVVATGWKPYNASQMENLGFGRLPDVITNVMMERMASPEGPTGGRIRRRSDGGAIRRIAFVQCAGSRDEHHLDFCSTVCCVATFKQCTYVREQYPDAEIHIFYIDLRAMGTLEDFMVRVQQDDGLHLHKGKVAKIWRGEGNDLVVVAEDTMTGQRIERVVDLAVLATGMQPEAHPAAADENGFVPPAGQSGVHAAGCARHPVEVASAVRDGTAAALRAIQDLRR